MNAEIGLRESERRGSEFGEIGGVEESERILAASGPGRALGEDDAGASRARQPFRDRFAAADDIVERKPRKHRDPSDSVGGSRIARLSREHRKRCEHGDRGGPCNGAVVFGPPHEVEVVGKSLDDGGSFAGLSREQGVGGQAMEVVADVDSPMRRFRRGPWCEGRGPLMCAASARWMDRADQVDRLGS